MQEAVKEVVERLQAGSEVKFVRRMLGGAVEVEIWVPFWQDPLRVLVFRFVDGRKREEREEVVHEWSICDKLTAGWQVS